MSSTSPTPDDRIALAVDLGGTKVEAALIRGDGTILPGSRHRAATGARAASDPDRAGRAVEEVVSACRTHPEWERVVGAGIGSAGPVDLPSGTVSPLNLPAAAGLPLAEIVRASSGLDDVTLHLDGTCIALAECWLGAARGARNAIVIVVSTGIGGGILSDGRLVTGRSGNAGHLGQVIVDRVESDAVGATVERLASGPATVAWANTQGWTGTSGEDLARDLREGNPVARAAVDRSARMVGIALAGATTLLDLEVAVVGGGFSHVSEDYIDRIQAAAHAHSVHEYAARLRVARAGLGGEAPLVGAAALVHRPDLLGA